MSIAEIAQEYISKHDWRLVTIPAGSKAPRDTNWPEKAIADPGAAHAYYEANPTHNIGLLHGASGTAAFDVDNVEWTKIIFDHLGIDYEALMKTCPRIVGRPDRGKLLFRVPTGSNLRTHKISWPHPENPTKREVVFELRAGAVQDVLPPSIHPDTGQPYTWAGQSISDGLPEIPQELLTIWEQWDRFRPQLMDACPWITKPTNTPPPRPKRYEGESIIAKYNSQNPISGLLEKYGYKQTRGGRWLSPHSTSGLAGVVVFSDTNTAYSHHASDPFDEAHSFDPFDLFCEYEHQGDASKAAKAISENFGVTTLHTYDPEAVAHGKKVAEAILAPKQDSGPLADIPAHLLSVPGRLQDVVNYYNITAPREQPQFAVQTALAFGSVVMGRRWVTDQMNYSGLYFVNVGKSSAGKEHPKTVLERLLEASGAEHLIGTSGYTSASGVFSSLVDKPTHLTIIDELGRVLQSSSSQGNYNKVDAQTMLMEIFGRQNSTLRPQGFSKMGMNKNQAEALDRVVRHPSLTLLSMTTPSTLYDNLSSHYVSDGFLGRFIIVESHIGRQPGKVTRQTPPPQRLLDWAKEHHTAFAGGGDLSDMDSHDMPPNAVLVPFHEDCLPMLYDFDLEMIGMMDDYERYGMEAMFGRTKEIGQRIALIVARSKGEETVSPDSLSWALDYVRFYALRTVSSLRKHMSDGPFEAACKAVLEAVGNAGLKGVTDRELSRSVGAWRNLEPRRRKDVMEALCDDHGLLRHNANEGKPGRPRWVWFLPGDEG